MSPYDVEREPNANPNPNCSSPDFSANCSPNEKANDQPWNFRAQKAKNGGHSDASR
jgi:hypothetical protein